MKEDLTSFATLAPEGCLNPMRSGTFEYRPVLAGTVRGVATTKSLNAAPERG